MKHLTQTDKRKIIHWMAEGFGVEDMAVFIARSRIGNDADAIRKETAKVASAIRSFIQKRKAAQK